MDGAFFLVIPRNIWFELIVGANPCVCPENKIKPFLLKYNMK